MKEEPIYTEGKYALFAVHDQDAQDPYHWDFMPPMMRFSGRSHYESMQREREFDASDIIRLLKAEHCDTREKREKLLGIWGWYPFSRKYTGMIYRTALKCIADERVCYKGKIADAFCDWIKDQDFDEPYSWRGCISFFDRLEELCEVVGIACINEQSNGYSQGDAYCVFMAATPEWLEETGHSGDDLDTLKENLMVSFRTWSAWAWGDCYGYVIKEINEDGDYVDVNRLEDSVWGYYGYDHKNSGLLEDGKRAIEHFIKLDIKEEAASFEAACRDIVTV